MNQDMLNISVVQVPGIRTPLSVCPGTTVAQAIAEAGLDTSGFTVRVALQEVRDFNRPLNNGETITLVKQIKGN